MDNDCLPCAGEWRAIRWILPPFAEGEPLQFLYAAAPASDFDLEELRSRLAATGICQFSRPAVGPLFASWRFAIPCGCQYSSWRQASLATAFHAFSDSCLDPSWILGPEPFASDAQFRLALPGMAEREILRRAAPLPFPSEEDAPRGRGRL